MADPQPGILLPVPGVARYLAFSLCSAAGVRDALRALADVADGERSVVGIGRSTVGSLGKTIAGLRTFPHHAGPAADTPSTPFALWIWQRGEDRGELVGHARALASAAAPAFRLEHVVDGFRYGTGRDLTGYEDGTENPKGDRAREVAIVGSGSTLAGSSFVAVQQWVHDLDRFESLG